MGGGQSCDGVRRWAERLGSARDGAGRCGFCHPVHPGPSPQMQLLERENEGSCCSAPQRAAGGEQKGGPKSHNGDEEEEIPLGVWVTRSTCATQPWGRCELFCCCHGQLCCHVQSTELQGLQALPLTISQGCSMAALLPISILILISIAISILCTDLNDTLKQASKGDGRCSCH